MKKQLRTASRSLPPAYCLLPSAPCLVATPSSMKKASAKRNNDDLRSEYDLSQLKGGVRGKHYREATAGTNLVLIEPELANVFPDTESVNRALPDTAESAIANERASKEGSKQPAET